MLLKRDKQGKTEFKKKMNETKSLIERLLGTSEQLI